MPDNDFWIGQEQIPVDLSLLLTYHNDEDYWYAPGEYALRVYTVDTLNTNFARPCFALGERTSDPEMEDVSGAIENTLHELLDSGATPDDVYRIMGLVQESELSPETKEAGSYLSIDLGYCIDGNIVSYEAVPEGVATVPENVDYPRYAEAMESHVPLPIATQIASHDFSHGQADILMEAARNPHVSPETLETIADKTLSSGKMRGLLDIACHPSRDRYLRHPAHRGHQAGRHGKLRGARSGDEYGLECLQQAVLHPLLRPVTGYGCLRVRKRQENRSARRPIRASACGELLRSRY